MEIEKSDLRKEAKKLNLDLDDFIRLLRSNSFLDEDKLELTKSGEELFELLGGKKWEKQLKLMN